MLILRTRPEVNQRPEQEKGQDGTSLHGILVLGLLDSNLGQSPSKLIPPKYKGKSRREVIHDTISRTIRDRKDLGDAKPLFVWVPSEALSTEQRRDILNADCTHIDLNVEGTMKVPVDSINCVRLEPQLSVFQGKACCLTSIVFTVCSDDDDSQDIHWPEMWFDPLNGTIDSPLDVLGHLREWIRPFKRDFVGLEDGTNQYYLTEQLQPLRTTRWPAGLPQPREGSAIHKISTVGFGLISQVLGSPTANKLEDVGFDVLNQFAKVTTFAKDKTTQALEHPLARPLLPLIPENVRSQFLTTEEASALLADYDSAHRYLAQFSQDLQGRIGIRRSPSEEEFIPDTTCDFENLRKKYQSHFSGTPLTKEKWNGWHDDEGRLKNFLMKGIEPSLRRDVWIYLLKAVDWTATTKEVDISIQVKKEQYLQMRRSWRDVLEALGDASPTRISEPHDGAVGDENENADAVTKLKERKYRIDKDVVRTDQTIDFFKLDPPLDTTIPLSTSIDRNVNLTTLRNVLMTYTIFNFELGYVQGMNDLAAPILETVVNESEAFWCFAGFMERMKPNFQRDQIGMRDQLRRLELLLKVIDPPLYHHLGIIPCDIELTDSVNMFCCFRWLLILFKREFDFEELKTLWETIWACPLTAHFHLYIAVAILNLYRQELFQCKAFDEVLKCVNNLSMNLNVPELVQHAEILYYVFRDRLVVSAPGELGESVSRAIGTGAVERMLSSISGIVNSDIVLDQTHYPKQQILTEEEWIESIILLEIDSLFVAPKDENDSDDAGQGAQKDDDEDLVMVDSSSI